MAANADAAHRRTSNFDVDVTDHFKPSLSDSDQHPNEGAPLLPVDLTDGDLKHTAAPLFTNESRALSPSPSTRPLKAERPTGFSHPAAVEEQRIIWLPKDRLGLVNGLEKELGSDKIMYSSHGAKIDKQGKVTVTSASPEDVRRAPIPQVFENEGDDDEKGIVSDMMDVLEKLESRLTR